MRFLLSRPLHFGGKIAIVSGKTIGSNSDTGSRMKIFAVLFPLLLLISFNCAAMAEDFYLDSPRNKGTIRFEIDNDIIWNRDSNFSNGWSLQYHTARYAAWEDTRMPGFIQWVGTHFPTLNNEDSMVRIGQGIGQNMITPGDLTAEVPQDGDLPYAGTLTYSLNWQSFNRNKARNFQVSFGVLGEESLAEDFQKFVHNNIGGSEDPQGWDTQRESEPIIDLAYEHAWRVGHVGNYLNEWGGS